MADLWDGFLRMLSSLEGVRQSEARWASSALKGIIRDYQRSVRKNTQASAQTPVDDGGDPNANAANTPHIPHGEEFHKLMIDTCIAALSSPESIRAARSALRRHFYGLFSSSPNRSIAAVSDDTAASAPPPQSHPLLGALIDIPEGGSEVSAQLAVYSADLDMETIVRQLGSYVRNVHGPRRSAGNGITQHFMTIDLCRQYLHWQDQRIENIHSGIGVPLATAKYIHRRRLVFVVSSEHAKAWGEPSQPASQSAGRFPWRTVKEVTESTNAWRLAGAATSSGGKQPRAAIDGAGEVGNLSSSLTEATHEGQEDERSVGSGAASLSAHDRFAPVHVVDSTHIRCAPGIDAHGVNEILAILKATILQWEKQAAQDHERRKAASSAAAGHAASSSSQPQPVQPPTSEIPLHVFQVLFLVDCDAQHATATMMDLIQALLLPKLEKCRLFAQSRRETLGAETKFHMFHHVIFYGRKLLQLAVPPALDTYRAEIQKSARTAARGNSPSSEESLAAAAAQCSASAAMLQLCILHHCDRVALSFPSDGIFPNALAADLNSHIFASNVVLSFHRTPAAFSEDGGASRRSTSRPVTVLFNFPGGERLLQRHALHLLFQLWAVNVLREPMLPPVSSAAVLPTAAPAVDEREAGDARRALVSQFGAYVSGLQHLVPRTEALCRCATTLQSFPTATTTTTAADPPSIFSEGGPTGGPSVTGSREMAPDDEVGEGEARTASQPTHVLEVIYADLLNVVFRATLRYPPASLTCKRGSGEAPLVPVRYASSLVTHTTALALLASTFAAFGVNTVVYEDDVEEPQGNVGRGGPLQQRQTSDDDDRHHNNIVVASRGPDQVPLETRVVLGFSPLSDVSAFGKEFWDECLYAPLQRQMFYLHECYWPLLVRLRWESANHIRSGAIAQALSRSNPTVAAGGGVRSSGRPKPASSGPRAPPDRELFVVLVGDDEDRETLERAEKSGELGHALAMPVVRLFLIPTPYLVAASTAVRHNHRGRSASESTTSSISSSQQQTPQHSSSQPTGTMPSPSLAHATSAEAPFEWDDSSLLLPKVFEPEDADTLGRIAHEFGDALEARRLDYRKRAAAVATKAGSDTDAATVALPLLSAIDVRMCSAAVLHARRDDAAACGPGPLLPCVELRLEHQAGPYDPDDDSIHFLEGKSRLHSLLLAEEGALGKALLAWVQPAAEDTVESSRDVARAKEQALVHAIRVAERMLRSDGSASGTGGGDLTGSTVDDDHQPEAFDIAEHPVDGANSQSTTSSWWGWWSGAAASNAPGGSGGGLKFNMKSTKLERHM